MAKVKDFYGYLNSIAPFETQEDWDNSGMLVGDMDAEVKKVAVVLDITHEEIKKAKAIGADLIISHHPVIFNPIKSVTRGSVPYELVASSINALCCHTPLDIADGGTNDSLAELFERIFVRLCFDDIEGIVNDFLSDALLAVIHNVVDELCHQNRIVDRIRQYISFETMHSSRHYSSLLH